MSIPNMFCEIILENSSLNSQNLWEVDGSSSVGPQEWPIGRRENSVWSLINVTLILLHIVWSTPVKNFSNLHSWGPSISRIYLFRYERESRSASLAGLQDNKFSSFLQLGSLSAYITYKTCFLGMRFFRADNMFFQKEAIRNGFWISSCLVSSFNTTFELSLVINDLYLNCSRESKTSSEQKSSSSPSKIDFMRSHSFGAMNWLKDAKRSSHVASSKMQ